MKNLLKYSIYLAFAGLLFAGCSDDKPAPEPKLTVVYNATPIPAEGGALTFTVQTTAEWTATPSDDSWVQLSADRGTGNKEVTITADPNGGELREITITISAKTSTKPIEKTITVTQSAVAQTNYWQIGDTKYELTAGDIMNFGAWWNDNTWEFYLVLETGTVHYDEDEDDIVGNGHFLWLDIISSVGRLDDRTYDYVNIDDLIDDNDIVPGMHIMPVYTMGLGSANPKEFDIVGGTVTTRKINGNEYEVSFSLTDVNGVALTGYYKGPFTYYDWSE